MVRLVVPIFGLDVCVIMHIRNSGGVVAEHYVLSRRILGSGGWCCLGLYPWPPHTPEWDRARARVALGAMPQAIPCVLCIP